MKLSITGIELEFDIFEASKAEAFQRETEKLIKVGNDIKGEKDLGKCIRVQCKAVFNFIDALFGKNKHKEIFGESVNLRECLNVYNQINSAILKSKDDGLSQIGNPNEE